MLLILSIFLSIRDTTLSTVGTVVKLNVIKHVTQLHPKALLFLALLIFHFQFETKYLHLYLKQHRRGASSGSSPFPTSAHAYHRLVLKGNLEA